jgi:S-adenosyl-L-methionine hydrolase (adenosine-forming)
MAIITLTTDFGMQDHFVASMKGVILSLCPRATIVDVSHEVAAHAVTEGAFVLDEAWRTFPKKTVHVCVVDPGVGSARRPVLVETGGHYFLGPDNGVLALVYEREKKHKVRQITNEKLFRQPVSRTFHGRDVFAPVAAHLALGGKPSSVGPVIEDYRKPPSFFPVHTGKRFWTGQILKVDRFGNLITNFSVAEFEGVRVRPFELQVGTRTLTSLVGTYAEAPYGEPFVLVGSSGYLEVSLNQGHAAKFLGCEAGAPLELRIY